MSRIIFRRKVAGISKILGLVLALSLPVLVACSDNNNKNKANNGSVTAIGNAAIGGAYTLVDHTGKTVTDADFRGRPQLIYFGYAYCPDVCPTALQQLGLALEMAGRAAKYYQPIFITIDYERDTPEKLAQYVTAEGFPKELIALTGSAEQIEHAKKIFKVYGKKIANEDSPDDFTYDHTSIVYLMDKDGKFIDVFTHNTTAQEIANRLIAYKKTG